MEKDEETLWEGVQVHVMMESIKPRRFVILLPLCDVVPVGIDYRDTSDVVGSVKVSGR